MTTEAEKERRRKLVKRAIYEIDETGLSSASKSAYRSTLRGLAANRPEIFDPEQAKVLCEEMKGNYKTVLRFWSDFLRRWNDIPTEELDCPERPRPLRKRVPGMPPAFDTFLDRITNNPKITAASAYSYKSRLQRILKANPSYHNLETAEIVAEQEASGTDKTVLRHWVDALREASGQGRPTEEEQPAEEEQVEQVQVESSSSEGAAPSFLPPDFDGGELPDEQLSFQHLPFDDFDSRSGFMLLDEIQFSRFEFSN